MSNITVVHGKCFHNLLVTWIETIHAPAEKKNRVYFENKELLG